MLAVDPYSPEIISDEYLYTRPNDEGCQPACLPLASAGRGGGRHPAGDSDRGTLGVPAQRVHRNDHRRDRPSGQRRRGHRVCLGRPQARAVPTADRNLDRRPGPGRACGGRRECPADPIDGHGKRQDRGLRLDDCGDPPTAGSPVPRAARGGHRQPRTRRAMGPGRRPSRPEHARAPISRPPASCARGSPSTRSPTSCGA